MIFGVLINTLWAFTMGPIAMPDVFDPIGVREMLEMDF